jgi:hypothetical protein
VQRPKDNPSPWRNQIAGALACGPTWEPAAPKRVRSLVEVAALDPAAAAPAPPHRDKPTFALIEDTGAVIGSRPWSPLN